MLITAQIRPSVIKTPESQPIEKYSSLENFQIGSESCCVLKIRRPSGLGGSTPPPGTINKSRDGRWLQRYGPFKNDLAHKSKLLFCDAVVTGMERSPGYLVNRAL
jgi:hypothetical protein